MVANHNKRTTRANNTALDIWWSKTFAEFAACEAVAISIGNYTVREVLMKNRTRVLAKLVFGEIGVFGVIFH